MGKYVIERIELTEFQDTFETIIPSVNKAEYAWWPDQSSGPYRIQCPNGDHVLFVYSQHFNTIMVTVLRHLYELGSSATAIKIIESLQSDHEFYMSDKGRISLEELIEGLSQKYFLLSYQNRNILVPVFTRIKEASNYVEGGLLHSLVYHYNEFPAVFAPGKDKTLFPGDATINEILGAMVKTLVEGEGEGENVLVLKAPVRMETPSYEGEGVYRLVAKRDQDDLPYILKTFFREKDV